MQPASLHKRMVGAWSGVIPAVPLEQWREMKLVPQGAFTSLTPEKYPYDEPHMKRTACTGHTGIRVSQQVVI